jgi:predicted Zn-dependent protease
MAVDEYRRAISVSSEDAMLYVYLGQSYAAWYESPEGQERHAEEAKRAFDRAAARLPDGSPSWFYVYAPLGRLTFHQGRYDAAAEQFARALEVNPLSPEIQYSLGRAYEAAGKAAQACAAYREMGNEALDAPEGLVADARARAEALCEE